MTGLVVVSTKPRRYGLTVIADDGRERARSIATGLLHYPGVRCPSCGGQHFAIGRTTAECARRGGALLLTNSDPLRETKGPTE